MLRVGSLRVMLLLAVACLFPVSAFADTSNVLSTRFSTVRYSENAELEGFLWRITGRHLAGPDAKNASKLRVDELVNRVEDLLDMRPGTIHFDIVLEPVYSGGNIAFYSHEKKTIRVFVDRVTDGVLAHEIAHAVICQYFPFPPPERAQEILAQYVDQHLWNEPV